MTSNKILLIHIVPCNIYYQTNLITYYIPLKFLNQVNFFYLLGNTYYNKVTLSGTLALILMEYNMKNFLQFYIKCNYQVPSIRLHIYELFVSFMVIDTLSIGLSIIF